MKLRRITAALLAAAVMSGISVPAYAETVKEETASVAFLASSSKAWDGKTAMKEKTAYTLSKNVTSSSAVTVPTGSSLTVKKGCTLTIGEKGSLTVKGTLYVQKGAALSLKGTLTVNSGKTFKCDGTLTFGNKAVMKSNGRFYLLENGKITGTPSKVTFGKTASCVLAGTNNCKKITTATENMYASMKKASSTGKVSASTAKKELEEHYNRHLKLLFTDKAYMSSICSLYDDYIINELKKTTGTTNADAFFYDNISTVSDNIISIFSLGNITSASKLKSVSVKLGEVYDCTSLDGAKEALKSRFGNITQYWVAEATYNFTMTDGTTNQLMDAVIGFVYLGGKIYLVSEELSNATYRPISKTVSRTF